MQPASVRLFKRLSRRFFSRFIVCLPVGLLLVQTTLAQTAGPASPSVVLVLKLVSTTLVKPTTGIVISADGLVMVSADFVSTPGEVVVLDGGTDILKNGRPASVVTDSVSGNLAILSVAGLTRPGVVLAETDQAGTARLHLEAFPPAQNIAKGEPPLWLPFKVVSKGPGTAMAVSSASPLPYVSGAVIDDCGYLAGFSLTSGAQTLETDQQPLVIFTGDLRRILESAQVTLPVAVCAEPANPSETVVVKDTVGVPVDAPTGKKRMQDDQPADSVAVEIPAPPKADSASVARQHGVSGDAIQVPAKIADRLSPWRSMTSWLPVAGLLLLALLAWKAGLLFRWANGRQGPGIASRVQATVQPASDEPDTARLRGGADVPAPGPRSGSVDEAPMPDINNLSDGCDGLVVIEGALDAGTHFRRFCEVNTTRFNIVIGRGDTDISIEHPAVSRRHALLAHDADSMTLSDLGSSNGTFIKGVPCLQGEIMFVEAGDEILLGNIRFRIGLIRQETDPA